MKKSVPFNKPFATGSELEYLRTVINSGVLSGDGPYTELCTTWLEEHSGAGLALLTHSCTAALEMAALLANIQPGDEVIMPSFTFVSTANAFVLRGAVPVFVDIRPDTLNLDEWELERGLTAKTKAIVPVHYAGVGCEMDAIMAFARHHKLVVIEDAAQGVNAKYRGQALGTFGHMGALSFHETKNLTAGEGGALLVNDLGYGERALVIREKGTNRSQFRRGMVEKYTWIDLGSSYAPSELTAAFLWAQFEASATIHAQREQLWQSYHAALKPLEEQGLLRRPLVPAHCQSNFHIYYVLLASRAQRDGAIEHLLEAGFASAFHYVALHSSPAGVKYGRAASRLPVTAAACSGLLRLPLWLGMEAADCAVIAEALAACLRPLKRRQGLAKRQHLSI